MQFQLSHLAAPTLVLALGFAPLSAQAVEFGAGCPGASGFAPTVVLPAYPYSGHPFLLDVHGPPNTSGALFVGVSNTTWSGVPLPFDLGGLGFPGCGLVVSPDVIVPFATSASGTFRLSAQGFPVGKTAYVQAFVIDTAGPILGGFSFGVGITGPGAPNVGDIVITEIMQNPDFVGDQFGEYFEVYNRTSNTINLEGWTLRDDVGAHVIDTGGNGFLIGPQEYLVFGRQANPQLNGGTTIHYGYGGDLQLANTFDSVTVESYDGTVIDTVAYDDGATFPDPIGRSMSLNFFHKDHVKNDLGNFWCEGKTTIGGPSGNTDRGTPGVENPLCSSP